MSEMILYAVALCESYNIEHGFDQPLLHITKKSDWDKDLCSDWFDDSIHSMLHAFDLEELVEGVFEPSHPLNSEDLAEIARSLGFIFNKDFEEVAKVFNLGYYE